MAKLFTEDHEWIEVDGNKATVGISEYAQDQLGDIVFLDVPDVDDEFDAGEEFATVESVKSTSEIHAPVTGKIVEINEELEDAPETVNESAEGDGWIAVIELDGDVDESKFMDKAAYDNFTADL